MEPYRIVYLGKTGGAQWEQIVACRDTEEAIEHADTRHVHEIEVWRDGRLVARFPSVAAMAGAPPFGERH